jgi:hypothetical protein
MEEISYVERGANGSKSTYKKFIRNRPVYGEGMKERF